eukprot:TRINITY_DN16962_c0_g1_i1.p1 TRINITY_DN16962_c0_g1~~TRINITY_DN16962_c0_g1_i1.p1  ORF type:complete len:507 (-),score=76.37 TRINITY_DN16962_c0_g1_i1:15-1436(-)
MITITAQPQAASIQSSSGGVLDFSCASCDFTGDITLANKTTSMATIARKVNYITKNVFNVQYYGATGDGITNDTPAFLTAISNMYASPSSSSSSSVPNTNKYGTTLYIPPGKYLITSTLVFGVIDDRMIKITGDPGTTILWGMDANLFSFTKNATADLIIHNLRIISTVSKATSSWAFVLPACVYCSFERIKIFQLPANYGKNCIANFGGGFQFSSGYSFITLVDITAAGYSGAALQITQGSHATLKNAVLYGCFDSTGNTVLSSSSVGVHLAGQNYFVALSSMSIYMSWIGISLDRSLNAMSNDEIYLDSITVRNSATYGILIQDSSNVFVTKMRIAYSGYAQLYSNNGALVSISSSYLFAGARQGIYMYNSVLVANGVTVEYEYYFVSSFFPSYFISIIILFFYDNLLNYIFIFLCCVVVMVWLVFYSNNQVQHTPSSWEAWCAITTKGFPLMLATGYLATTCSTPTHKDA